MVTTTKAIQQALDKAKHVLVITHVDPDGDAFGSLTAVGLALQQLGKQATLVCDDNLPLRFRYLPLAEQVQKSPEVGVEYDLLIAVDCGDELRMGRAYANLPDPKPLIINIDHHVTNTQFGAVNLVRPDTASTTEVLYDLFRELDVTLTADLALSLLTGLVTDTLGFRTTGVTANTMKITSILMDAGADLSLVTMQALNLKPLSTLRLWQVGLNNMRVEDGLIWSSISKEELKATGHLSPSSAGLVNLMADVDQAAMSAVLMEMADGLVRVGLRCRPPYDVSELAMNLGGGGHPLAAGCTLDGPLAKAEALVVGMCKDAIRYQSALARDYH